MARKKKDGDGAELSAATAVVEAPPEQNGTYAPPIVPESPTPAHNGPVSNRPPHNLFAWLSAFWARFATALLALLLVSSIAVAAEEEKTKLGEFIPATPPQPAPEVAFTDMDGKPVKLADFRGKLLVVNLWATWCLPCLEEMPSLEQLQINLADKLLVIAVDHRNRCARSQPAVRREFSHLGAVVRRRIDRGHVAGLASGDGVLLVERQRRFFGPG